MKNCNKCDVRLVIGETWSVSKQKHSDYRCIKCTTAYRKAWAVKRGDIEVRNRRRNHYRRQFGITMEYVEEILEQQNHCCAICSVDIGKKFHLDHCHETQQVRGVLCQRCNQGLGLFGDNPIVLNNAVRYLEDARKRDTSKGSS